MGTTYRKTYGISPVEASTGDGERHVCVCEAEKNLIRSKTNRGKDWVKEQEKWRTLTKAEESDMQQRDKEK